MACYGPGPGRHKTPDRATPYTRDADAEKVVAVRRRGTHSSMLSLAR
jgi:hypothetical protein